MAPILSAEELHACLLKSHRAGNLARRKFIDCLLLLKESRLHLKLGYSSVQQYAEKHFKYRRTQTFEFLRVAQALRELPACKEAFDEGRLSYTVIQEITRIAKPATETEWVAFALKETPEKTRREVKDALEKGRELPRKDRFGLPGQPVQVRFELSPEESDLFEKALRKVSLEMGKSLSGKTVDSKTALLFIARRILETDPAGGLLPDRSEREGSIYTLLYHHCPSCLKAYLQSEEGPVEVPAESIERVEAEAETITIHPEEERPDPEPAKATPQSPQGELDPPSSPYLVKKVFLRDGGTCSNPGCRRALRLHAHHLIFRSLRGRTALFNECLLCDVCHSLAHTGALVIEGDPVLGLSAVFRK